MSFESSLYIVDITVSHIHLEIFYPSLYILLKAPWVMSFLALLMGTGTIVCLMWVPDTISLVVLLQLSNKLAHAHVLCRPLLWCILWTLQIWFISLCHALCFSGLCYKQRNWHSRISQMPHPSSHRQEVIGLIFGARPSLVHSRT